MPAQQVLRIFLLLSGKTDNVVKDGLSCSVGALLALASGKAERRQVHPLSVPPFAFAVRSDSVRRPIRFRPPPDRIPYG